MTQGDIWEVRLFFLRNKLRFILGLTNILENIYLSWDISYLHTQLLTHLTAAGLPPRSSQRLAVPPSASQAPSSPLSSAISLSSDSDAEYEDKVNV